MSDPESLQKRQLAKNDSIDLDSEHSVDDHFKSTEDFLSWARNKKKYTDLDKENRHPMQVLCLDSHNFSFSRVTFNNFLVFFSFRFQTVRCRAATIGQWTNQGTVTVTKAVQCVEKVEI